MARFRGRAPDPASAKAYPEVGAEIGDEDAGGPVPAAWCRRTTSPAAVTDHDQDKPQKPIPEAYRVNSTDDCRPLRSR